MKPSPRPPPASCGPCTWSSARSGSSSTAWSSALREAAGKGGVAGFNEDKFTAGEAQIGAILGATRMIPMMAPRRFVMVRGLDRWEKKEGDDDAARPAADVGGPGKKARPRRAPSTSSPTTPRIRRPTTVLVLVSPKLHGQRRLVTAAKKGGFLVSCEPLSREALPRWIEKAAQEKGHRIAPEVADLLAEIAGPELGYVADAVERLSLYVGAEAPITEDAVAAVVTRVRQSSVWELIDALGRRNTAAALAVLADVFDPRDGGLRLLGAVAWSVRQLVKFDSALRSGSDPREAAPSARACRRSRRNDTARTVRGAPAGGAPRVAAPPRRDGSRAQELAPPRAGGARDDADRDVQELTSAYHAADASHHDGPASGLPRRRPRPRRLRPGPAPSSRPPRRPPRRAAASRSSPGTISTASSAPTIRSSTPAASPPAAWPRWPIRSRRCAPKATRWSSSTRAISSPGRSPRRWPRARR